MQKRAAATAQKAKPAKTPSREEAVNQVALVKLLPICALLTQQPERVNFKLGLLGVNFQHENA